MYAPPDNWPGQPRYGARQEVHLNPVTWAKLKGFVTSFRRSRSEALRHLLQWGLDHGQGWKIARGRMHAQAHRIFLRIEPELRQQMREAATAAGDDVSAWLRHAFHLVTVADLPASWQAASTEQGHAPLRAHDSRTYSRRFMLRMDTASWRKLDTLAQRFDRSAADIIRQLIAQASPEDFPQSWRMAANERRAQQGRPGHDGLAGRDMP